MGVSRDENFWEIGKILFLSLIVIFVEEGILVNIKEENNYNIICMFIYS